MCYLQPTFGSPSISTRQYSCKKVQMEWSKCGCPGKCVINRCNRTSHSLCSLQSCFLSLPLDLFEVLSPSSLSTFFFSFLSNRLIWTPKLPLFFPYSGSCILENKHTQRSLQVQLKKTELRPTSHTNCSLYNTCSYGNEMYSIRGGLIYQQTFYNVFAVYSGKISYIFTKHESESLFCSFA